MKKGLQTLLALAFGLFLLASCGGKEPEVKPASPAIRVTLEEVSAFQAKLVFETIQTVTIRYGLAAGDATPVLDQTLETGSDGQHRIEWTLKDLTPDIGYRFAARGIGPAGEEGSLQSLTFRTSAGPGELYPWERARGGHERQQRRRTSHRRIPGRVSAQRLYRAGYCGGHRQSGVGKTHQHHRVHRRGAEFLQ